MADTKDSGEFQFACIVGDLRVMQSSLFTKKPTEDEGAQNTECRCLRMEINGRSIVIFMVGDDKLFAMDQKCYHAGGPLNQGDIEDIDGRLCVTCPWHSHQITLDSGESLYHSVDVRDPRHPKQLRSKGVRQRVHEVKLIGDKVFVRLCLSGQKVDSDFYYSEEYGRLMKL